MLSGSSIQGKAAEIKGRWLGLADRAVGEWGIPAVVVLVGLGSFGLGRLSDVEDNKPVVSIREAASTGVARAMPLGGQFVASRSGTVYYFPWCGGAQQIPVEMQVWFASENVAQRAGYRPAKNCRGLDASH